MFEFLKKILQFFEQHNIPYMMSGSVAMSMYVVPRATKDIDFIIHLKASDIPFLLESFGEGYYCDEDAIKDAMQRQSLFNIIDFKSGFKADFVILKNEPYRIVEFGRKKLADFFGSKMYVVSPEDLLISKLIWVQDYQSEIQFEDIRNLAALHELDWIYIKEWVKNLRLNTFGLIPS